MDTSRKGTLKCSIGKLAGSIEGDQGPTVSDKLEQSGQAVLSDSAGILRRDRSFLVTADNGSGRDIGQDNDIVFLFEMAVADLRILKGRIRKLPLVEDPTGPTLVHIGDPGLVETQP